MARIAYPTQCTSAYCGKILCDGCPVRERLAAYYDRTGELAGFEERQAKLRAEKAEKRGIWAVPA